MNYIHIYTILDNNKRVIFLFQGPNTFNDGLIEVIGIDNHDLPELQLGRHAKSVCQCKTAVVTTSKVIHMKVDGEPVLMKPCEITITLNTTNAPPGRMLFNQNTYNNCFDKRFSQNVSTN